MENERGYTHYEKINVGPTRVDRLDHFLRVYVCAAARQTVVRHDMLRTPERPLF